MGLRAKSRKRSSRRVAVTDGVWLYCTPSRRGVGASLAYDVECARFRRAIFTLVLTQVENAECCAAEGARLEEEAQEVRIVGTIEPFRRQRLGLMTPVDETKPLRFKTTFRWELLPPDEAQVAALLAENRELLAPERREAERLGFGEDSASVAELERRCELHGVQFLDADFPPGPESLYGMTGSDALGLVWRRAGESLGDGKLDVFVAGVEPRDIRQGALADCWFLCALASLAEFEPLVRRLFLEESQSHSRFGVYKMRFCKNGEWQAVVIDDFVPCFPGGGPAYGRSHGSELWVMLLEKAYAKLHGSYSAIRMGWAFEAMLDLTGAPYKTVHLDEVIDAGAAEKLRLWTSLLRWDRQAYIMSASTPGEDTFTETGERPPRDGTGLVHGHAYTVLEARQTKDGHRLVLLRNPWGNFEWTGAWSDRSELWTDAMQEEVGAVLDDQDGTFWMSFDDVLQHFFSLNVCMVKHCAGGSKAWIEQRKKVSFRYSPENGQAVTGSMYMLIVSSPTRAFVSVHQEDIRCANAKPYLDIGVTILRIQSNFTYELVGSGGNTTERQCQVDEVFLSEGQYLVVPTTTGCKFRQGVQEAEEADDPNDSRLWQDGAEGRRFSPKAEYALNSIFRALDVNLDGFLNRRELNTFMQLSEGCELSGEVFEWVLSAFDSVDGGLTADGFRQCYLYMWEQSGRNDETIWRDLVYHGFDRQLNRLFSRTVILAVHTDETVELLAQPFEPEIYEEAMELPIKALGECKRFDEAQVALYVRKGGFHGVSLAAENLGRTAVRFSLDMSNSTNVTSHRGSLVHTELIPPGETKVLHHIMPKIAEDSWSWKYLPEARPAEVSR